MRSERGQSRLPLVLMVAGGLFLVWTVVRLLGGDGGGEDEAAALERRCSVVACRAADNPLPVRGYEGQSVVGDPDDPNHFVVIDANMLGRACSYHVTFDRGETWADGIFELPTGYTGCRINGGSGGHVPTGNAVMGPSGTIYNTFGSAHTDDGRRESVLVAGSNDGGTTWVVSVAARPPRDPPVGYGRPLLTATAGPAGQDSVLVSFWECQDNVCPRSYIARSDDAGRSFSAPVMINNPSQNPSMPAVAPNGDVYVLYQLRYSDGPVDLVLATSYDGGKSFTDSLVDTQLGLGGTRGYDPAKLVVDPVNGTLYTTYADARTARQTVFFRKSTDGGATWTPALGISPDAGATATRTPSLSLSPDGSRIDIAYYSQPLDKRDDVWWAFSTNGGETFVNRQVNDTQINREIGYVNEIGGWYPPGLSSTAAAALVAWSDTVNGDDLTNTVDILVRRMVAIGAGLDLPP